MNALTGIPLVMTPHVRDGQVLKTQTMILIGTRPLTEVEFAGEEGRYIVRRGMADVLQWLGEKVGPAPMRSGKGEATLAAIKAVNA